MNLLNIENGHLTALFHISRAKGQLFMPDAAAMLVSKFNFSTYPQSYNDFSAEKIEFKHANFKDVAIESLSIFSDGIVISSRSDTDIIDSFYLEFCGWLQSELEISFIKTHEIERLYESVILVKTDKNIMRHLDPLTEIAGKLQSDLKENSGLDVKYEPFGWAFSADSTQNPALKPVSLRIERRAGTAYSMHHYISSAPLKTKQHLALLEKLESLV